MSAILKTLPTRFARGKISEFLNAPFAAFFFTLGMHKPKQAVEQLYFTHQGRLLGYFTVQEIVQNAGQLPKLTTLDGAPSKWQIKPDRWVAVCDPPFHLIQEKKIYHEAFRGWRYFDLEAFRSTPGSKIRI